MLVLSLVLCGCTSREEKAVLLIEEISGAFARHGTNCDVLAKELDGLVAGNTDALDALAESDASKDARKRMGPYRKRIDAAVDVIVKNAATCGSDPRVTKVVEKLL